MLFVKSRILRKPQSQEDNFPVESDAEFLSSSSLKKEKMTPLKQIVMKVTSVVVTAVGKLRNSAIFIIFKKALLGLLPIASKILSGSAAIAGKVISKIWNTFRRVQWVKETFNLIQHAIVVAYIFLMPV